MMKEKNVYFDEMSTFSIAAYDPDTKDLGVAVQSKAFSVGSAVPWAEPEVGAIATQAATNISYGPEGLKLLRQGLTAQEVVETLTEADENRERRQLGVVDIKGNSYVHTGLKAHDWKGSRIGRNYSVQGNTLESEDVVISMAEAFETARGELAERLVRSLEAGQFAGGDTRGSQSAALLVVRKGMGSHGYGDRYIDLRIDDHKTPIQELSRLLKVKYSNFNTLQTHRLIEEGKIKAALLTGQKAVEWYPDNDKAHMALCRAYFLNGYTRMSIEAFQKAVLLNPKCEIYWKGYGYWDFIAENNKFLRARNYSTS